MVSKFQRKSSSTPLCTIGSKISFTPKEGRFCEENFLRYLDLCYVNPSYHILKTYTLYYRLWTNQKLQEIVLAKSVTLGVKDILLQLAPNGKYDL